MKRIGTTIILLVLAQFIYANGEDPVDDDITPAIVDSVKADSLAKQLILDNPFLQQIDSVWTDKFYASFKYVNDTNILNTGGYAWDEIPVFSDSVMEARMNHLDSLTPISLKYDKEIQRFIELYANRRRGLMSKLLGLSRLYYPMFEEQLDKYDLPLELKHLAIVESALKPRARSRVGATGLWQFMYATGKIYDLNVTSYTDDRMDPLKSTIAACQYFEFLYGMFGDWNLVLAAYNSGPGNVNKAIRRSGGKRSYWDIRRNLPRETRGYVPAFIAVNYVMNYASEHNIYPLESPITFAETDTVHVSDVVKLSQISEVLEIDMELLTFLNPTYKRNIIPFIESSTQEFVLRLPTNKIGDFINNECLVYEHKLEKEEEEESITQERLVHTVRRGEFLGSIANRYNCRVSDLKSWNSMNGTSIYPGQKLVVFGSQAAAQKHQGVAVTKAATKSNPTSSDNKYIYHTIQSGDTLWDIARKYNGSSVDKIREMNRIGNAYRLKPGTKIKVATSS